MSKMHKLGIILEFKKVDSFENQTLEQAAQNALTQIQAKKYAQEMQSCGVARVVPVAIAFAGKEVLVMSTN